MSLYIDLIKNKELLLDKAEMENYSFRFGEPVMIDNRPHHQVNFQPRLLLPYALYFGSLYIDKETMAITRAEFNLSMDDRSKATRAMLRKKPFGLRFKPEQMTFLIAYKQHDGRSYLNYVRNEVRFKCDWKRRLFRRLIRFFPRWSLPIEKRMIFPESPTKNPSNPAILYQIKWATSMMRISGEDIILSNRPSH